jgi:hypothetical protein
LDLTLAILSNPCPVIFVDTCALLDVIRAGFRKDVRVDVLSAAVELGEELNSGNPKVRLVATANVISELQENRSKVLSELAAGLANLKAQLLRMTHAASIVLPERQLSKPNWIDDELSQRIDLYWIV